MSPDLKWTDMLAEELHRPVVERFRKEERMLNASIQF